MGKNTKVSLYILLMTGLWTLIYAVFSFGFETDPEACVVSNKKDLVATRFSFVDSENAENADQIDVAERFKFFFDNAFILSSVQLTVGTLGLFY